MTDLENMKLTEAFIRFQRASADLTSELVQEGYWNSAEVLIRSLVKFSNEFSEEAQLRYDSPNVR